MRGPLHAENYHPQFSGHQTFALRYGWLKKVYDRVAETERHEPQNREQCWGDAAIAHFGVGKNMVAAMRYWAKAARVITEPAAGKTETTDFGRFLFDDAVGIDPYMENPATLWLVHWQLAARAENTTWFWAFNHYPAAVFERDRIEKALVQFARDRGWKSAAANTIKNDVACFIRSYVARPPSRKAGHDDALESPLAELGLIKAAGIKDGFRFARGHKATLGDGVFTYALFDFWRRHARNTKTLSFEAIAHAPGGPGRVFVFDENDVIDRLSALGNVTGGILRWSETAGLKQVVKNANPAAGAIVEWVRADYGVGLMREAA